MPRKKFAHLKLRVRTLISERLPPHRSVRVVLSPAAQGWFDRYKERFKADPNIGALYGYNAVDLTVLGLERAGPNLTLDTFISGMESIKHYHDIFNSPEENFGPDKHQGANASFLAIVKGGRWVRLTDPLTF